MEITATNLKLSEIDDLKNLLDNQFNTCFMVSIGKNHTIIFSDN